MADSVERIKEIMNDRSLNSKELASRIGIQASTISHYFTGRNSPSASVLNKILAAFPEVNPVWLFSGQPPKYLNTAPQPSYRPRNDVHQEAQPSMPQNGLFPESELQSGSGRLQNDSEPAAAPDALNAFIADSRDAYSASSQPSAPNPQRPASSSSASEPRQTPGQESPAKERRITRIVVYYSDSTYEEFTRFTSFTGARN